MNRFAPVGRGRGKLMVAAQPGKPLVTALTGARMGFEASSFFVDQGDKPRIGQAFLVIDPAALAGNDAPDDRVEALCAALCKNPIWRLPGARRQGLAHRSARDGLEVSEVLMQILKNEGPKS